jgi:cation:H+ antiporter
MNYFLFLIGFVLLIVGADRLVKGAKGIASRFGVSELVIGLTIVSMGTSLPELLVNIIASIEESPGLAIGNILGSNIANILLVLGVTAIICKLPIHRSMVLSEIPFTLTAALLVGFLANSALWYEKANGLFLSRGDGILLIFFFFLFMAYIFFSGKRENTTQGEKSETTGGDSVWPNIFLIALGSVGLYFGGHWVVTGATSLARLFQMSEAFIGLTIVAIGTSLPELVTSILSALKKNTDIAIGNAVGSNIFNLLWILGISALIKPLPFNVASNVDLLMVIASSSLILLALILGRRMVIKRIEGIVFLFIYAAYIYFLIERG